MPYNVIDLSKLEGPFQDALVRLLEMAPAAQRKDENLKKLVAFRLKLDGEKKTAAYLKSKIRAAGQEGFSGKLFDYLIKGRHPEKEPEAVGSAGHGGMTGAYRRVD